MFLLSTIPYQLSSMLWNFKDGGSKKQDIWPRINILGESFFNPSMNYSLSKSAKNVLSKSICNVKNQLNFLKKKISSKNINLGDHFLAK